MVEESKVSLSKEKVEALKTERGLTDEVLEEILEGVQVESKPVSATVTKEEAIDAEARVFRSLGQGDISMGQAMFLSDYYDRKDRRKREDNTRKQPPRAEGIPEWAKPMITENKEILARMKSAEEEKKIAAAVKDATDPLKTELEKKDNRTTRLEETVAKLSEPPKEKVDLGKVIGASVAVGVATALKDAGIGATPPPKNYVDDYIESRDKLKKVGLLQEQKSNIMLGPGGQQIPISGEIPAIVAYIPSLIKEGAATIEETVDRIAKKYGLFEGEKPGKPRAPLIKMPEKPRAMPPKPPVAIEEVTTIELEKKPESLIVMPKKPTKEDVAAPEVAVVAKPPKKKGYVCKHCGTGGFEKPWQLASHSKKCPEAIEARKKMKEKKPDEQTTKKGK